MSSIIYLRSKNQALRDGNPSPGRGTPIGAIAYEVEDGFLNVSFALQNKKDRWDRNKARSIAMERLRLKREISRKLVRNVSPETNSSFEAETPPKFFRFELAPDSANVRPYDVLRIVLAAHEDYQIFIPEKLVRSIKTMLFDNEIRTQKLAEIRELEKLQEEIPF